MACQIRDFGSLAGLAVSDFRPLCLFSGGLDGTYLLYRLSRDKTTQPVALTIDLGGDPCSETAAYICNRLDINHIVVDRREEFAQDFVFPAIPAQARYLGGHPLSASLSRPIMAKVAVELAGKVGCNAIVHTSNPSQNSLRRFNGAISALGFKGPFGSPYDQSYISREAKLAELKGVGVEVASWYASSSDSNLWCREFEYGLLDDPEKINVPDALYKWTNASAGSAGDTIEIDFKRGLPCSLNGEALASLSLIERLNKLAGAFGLGRYEGLEEIEGGMKVQEFREMPAAFVLLDAYRRLESACISAECIREKMHVEQIWVREAVEGRWYSPLRRAAQKFIEEVAVSVEGSVKFKLSRMLLDLVFIKARDPLYISDRAKYESAHGKAE